MKKNKHLKCYVEDSRGVSELEIEFLNEELTVYERGQYDDDLEDWDDFLCRYGTIYYKTLEDFKKDNKESFEDWYKL